MISITKLFYRICQAYDLGWYKADNCQPVKCLKTASNFIFFQFWLQYLADKAYIYRFYS